MLPLLERIRATCDGPLAALPVPTGPPTRSRPSSRSPIPNGPARGRSRPRSTRSSAPATSSAEFAAAAHALGVSYLGVCCGAAPHHIRAVAEAIGRTPPASRFSADMSRHAFFGSDARLKDVNRSYAGDL